MAYYWLRRRSLSEFFPLSLGLALALSSALALPSSVRAQITPDETLGSEGSTVSSDVMVRDDLADLIEGGAIRGGNLFHSFDVFNIDEGQRVYFANPEGIDSILSRITGSNPSNIFGTLGVDGTADLFLLNPNGIVFGETAALDIGGSFYATTADSIPLGDGVYSATVPEQSNLLTVNPSALLSRYLSNTSGDITSLGSLISRGSITLTANQIGVEGSITPTGSLTLVAAGDVIINNGILLTPEAEAQGTLPTRDISILGRNILVLNSSLLASFQVASGEGIETVSLQNWPDPIGSALLIEGNTITLIDSLLTTTGFRGQRGDIRLNAKDFVDVIATQDLVSGLNSSINGNGTAGNITITATSLSVVDINSGINANDVNLLTTAPDAGNGGNITLDIRETALFSGGSASTIAGTGKAGNIQVSAGNLFLYDGATLNSGTGSPDDVTSSDDAGDITLEVRDTLYLGGFGRRLLEPPFVDNQVSAIFAPVLGNEGEAGAIRITTNQIYLENQASIGANSSNTGRAGAIQITASELQIRSGANISSNASGSGQAGNITLDISDIAFLTGASADGRNPSGVFSRTFDNSNGGSLNLSATDLYVLNGANLSTTNFGSGDGGSINLTVAETVLLEGNNPIDPTLGSRIDSSTIVNSSGNGGGISIQADEIILRDGGVIVSETSGQGNAGQQVLNVNEILITGGLPDRPSGFFADVNPGAAGNGGNQFIRADNLTIRDGGVISATTYGNGSAGNLLINSDEIYVLSVEGLPSGILTAVAEGGNGKGGNLEIRANQIIIENGAVVSSGTLGNGNAGDLTVRATDVQVIGSGGEGVFSSLSTVASNTATGNGGNLQIDAETLLIRDGAVLAATTNGLGNAGDIRVNSTSTILDGVDAETGSPSGILARTRESAQGSGGDINVNSRNLSLINGAVINAQTFNAFPSGDIVVNARSAEFIDGGQIVTSTSSSGTAGTITLNTTENLRFVGRDSTYGNRLQQSVSRDSVTPEEFSNESPSSGLFANTRPDSSGSGGRITVNSPTLVLDDGAQISSQSQGTGAAGPVILNAANRLQLTNSDIVTVASQSSGGNIVINQAEETNQGLVILFGDSDITTASFGDGGNITIGGAAVIAFDDSDIVARSQSARGGNITLSSFFSETLPPDSQAPFDGDGRVDVNADGQVASGVISSPNTSFVENSLTNLEETIIDTANLTAGSCIARTADDQGSFVVTGRDGLPQRPGDMGIAAYPTGTVQTIDSGGASLTRIHPMGSTVQEPDGVYQLPDGRLVLSRECGES